MLELYIGGYAQGKLDYVKSIYPDARVISGPNFKEELEKIPEEKMTIWNQFHVSVKENLQERNNSTQLREEVLEALRFPGTLAIISDEIGNGIVPMEEEERFYREFTGRLLIEIAAKADKVVRITCGIPQQIK